MHDSTAAFLKRFFEMTPDDELERLVAVCRAAGAPNCNVLALENM